MERTDFQTAFGRLLRSGPLRDAFCQDPRRTAEMLGLSTQDHQFLTAINPDDLEAQAQVLLRKRFDAVSRLLPQTFANAGQNGWPLFRKYARELWPNRQPAAFIDARAFCSYLESLPEPIVSPTESNRIGFGTSNRWLAVHFVRRGLIRGKAKSGFQILIRAGRRFSAEAFVSLGHLDTFLGSLSQSQ